MTRADIALQGVIQSLPIGYDAVEDASLFIGILFVLFILLVYSGKPKYPKYPPYNRRPPSNYPPFW